MSGPLCTAPPLPRTWAFRSGSTGDVGLIRKGDESSRADRAERVFTVGIFLYVVIRAIPIWKPLQDGSVNPWIFLGTRPRYGVSIRQVLAALDSSDAREEVRGCGDVGHRSDGVGLVALRLCGGGW